LSVTRNRNPARAESQVLLRRAEDQPLVESVLRFSVDKAVIDGIVAGGRVAKRIAFCTSVNE
jgi:hypothetical protein